MRGKVLKYHQVRALKNTLPMWFQMAEHFQQLEKEVIDPTKETGKPILIKPFAVL